MRLVSKPHSIRKTFAVQITVQINTIRSLTYINMQFDNLKMHFIFNMKVLNKETIFTSLPETGVNLIKILPLEFTIVAIFSESENNSCTCKLQV